jgi:SAM-dependent methyltransferase
MITEIERAKYQKMWSFDEYRKFSPAAVIADYSHDMFAEHGMIGSLIDFGCGTGRASRRFQQLGHDVTMVDFVPNAVEVDEIKFIESCLWELPANLSADNGFCADVMEHIPPAMVDETLFNIARAVKNIMIFQIALTPDSCGTLIGEKLHMTLLSSSQWKQRLSKHWTEIRSHDEGTSFYYVGRKTV